MTPPYGRKWRGTEEPLDESERGECKSWLKIQHSKNEDHGMWTYHFMANRGERMETVTDFIFLGSKTAADGNCSHEIKRYLFLGRKAMINLDSILRSTDIALPTKCVYSQSYGFPNSHVRMWELDPKEGWASKNWCFQTVVLEKTLESPLDCNEIKSVNPKGNQPWIFFGSTDAEAEVPILWSPDVKSRFTGKDTDAGKYWGQEKKGT